MLKLLSTAKRLESLILVMHNTPDDMYTFPYFLFMLSGNINLFCRYRVKIFGEIEANPKTSTIARQELKDLSTICSLFACQIVR